MNFETCAAVIDVLEAALTSPIGLALENQQNSLNCRLPFSEKYFTVIDNLNNNKYNSPESFLKEFNEAIDETVTSNNDESDLTLAIQSFQQFVNEELDKLFKYDGIAYRSHTQHYISDIRNNLSIIPNDISEFASYVNSMQHPKEQPLDYVYNDDSDIQDYEPEDHELLSIKNQLMRLKNDENLQEIGKMVRACEETVIVAPNGTIGFDLFKCSKYTIKLIQGMLATM
ncbi:hypothetical protein TVAG_106840 [Trichomonas vaginalis G3]|uniref:AF-9 ANC1 homology domain-containing protein n=1 Tax=Trichomonas vaginalis (strain ATCC PRA-98 / G3) TaxID=412133 RepID=A2E6H6_TRIV3|nr:ANC1 homology domain (AHD) family [Trichomonas vaginalis G3]EAY11789.1 hypothetical protein TVAG_106840 [Trichomonas vaginalis G3]KAI5540658.1 ANC1 homology domain (AHD) family [Trichomonas vaginalis G3]|eukprot:XP_001324012.1 hypothetical protein [Trichomonas vaginalis G3]